MTQSYENLPKIVKIILQIVLGYFVSAIYRILRYVETKNIVTLIVGVLCFFGVGVIFWIVDLVTELLSNKITLLAD